MNILLEGSSPMEVYTNLRIVFQAFANRQTEFNWLITDLLCSIHPPQLPYDRQIHWLSGQELTAVTQQFDFQVLWGVFSAFPPATKLDLQNLSVIPFADGNQHIWHSEQIQHPQAVIELVCWDSSATLLRSHDQWFTNQFRSFFPQAIDLALAPPQHLNRE